MKSPQGMNGLPKLVSPNTLLDPLEWRNALVIQSDLAAEMTSLKAGEPCDRLRSTAQRYLGQENDCARPRRPTSVCDLPADSRTCRERESVPLTGPHASPEQSAIVGLTRSSPGPAMSSNAPDGLGGVVFVRYLRVIGGNRDD
jgi:hypothetical protein